ncbi:hypothetical protein ACH4D7_16100 [Streptomyces sp. NPDC018063]|uniref:hypothetical protein n=1 Tax=Streptomyces sp. NPDC018063 TaxID=3365042 RepID=UPI0037ACBBFA
MFALIDEEAERARGTSEVIPLYLSRPLVGRALRIMHALALGAPTESYRQELREVEQRRRWCVAVART